MTAQTAPAFEKLQRHLFELTASADLTTVPLEHSVTPLQHIADTAAQLMTDTSTPVAFLQKDRGLARRVTEPLAALRIDNELLGLIVNHDTKQVRIASILGDADGVVANLVHVNTYVVESLLDYRSGVTPAPAHLEFARAVVRQCRPTDLGGGGEAA